MTGAPGPDDLAERHPGERLGQRLGGLRRDGHRGHRATEDERRDQHDLVVLGVDLGRAEHVEVPRHRRVGVGQAHDHVLAFHGLGTEHDPGHVDRILGTARMGDRAHERPVRVADVAVDHLEVALVDRQVDRLAQRPAAVVEGAARVGQLHEVAEVLDRGVAPALVEVVDERRAVGRHEDHVRVADLHAPRRVPGELGEDPGRRGLDQGAAHPAREADPLAVDVGAGAAEDLGRLGEVDDLDADLLEERVGVGLDLLETADPDDFDRRQLPRQERQRVHVPCQSLGLARGPAAPHRGVFEVRDRHLISSGAGAIAEIVPPPWYGDPRGSEAKGELATLEEGETGPPWGDRVPDEVERDDHVPSARRPARSPRRASRRSPGRLPRSWSARPTATRRPGRCRPASPRWRPR